MLYFKMSYQLQIIPVRGPECGVPLRCAQHLPVIQRKEKIIMEERTSRAVRAAARKSRCRRTRALFMAKIR